MSEGRTCRPGLAGAIPLVLPARKANEAEDGAPGDAPPGDGAEILLFPRVSVTAMKRPRDLLEKRRRMRVKI